MREQTVCTVLLTSGTSAESIAAQQQAAGASTLKLADHASPADLRQRQQGCPGVELVRGIHVTGEASVADALTVAPWVDAVLLDSGNPAQAVKELGGTGRAHDWALSRRLREAIHPLPLPLWLAGGLCLHNVAEAIAAVQPHGVDLCTGVRCGRPCARQARAISSVDCRSRSSARCLVVAITQAPDRISGPTDLGAGLHRSSQAVGAALERGLRAHG